jgi:hypothetical protein
MEVERTYTAFLGEEIIASGPLDRVLPEVKRRFDAGEVSIILFEDQTGQPVDFELRGPVSEVLARVLPAPARTGPGRPKLGVVSREVSLLPRHWTWLEQQRNGASAALRRLVDEARKQDPGRQRARLAMDAANRFMSAMAGNLPGYEEAGRALYAADRTQFEDQIRNWPRDIRAHVQRLAEAAFSEVVEPVG